VIVDGPVSPNSGLGPSALQKSGVLPEDESSRDKFFGRSSGGLDTVAVLDGALFAPITGHYPAQGVNLTPFRPAALIFQYKRLETITNWNALAPSPKYCVDLKITASLSAGAGHSP
jgi:hypothetical protein